MQHHTLPQTSTYQQYKPSCFEAVQSTNMKRLQQRHLISMLMMDDIMSNSLMNIKTRCLKRRTLMQWINSCYLWGNRMCDSTVNLRRVSDGHLQCCHFKQNTFSTFYSLCVKIPFMWYYVHKELQAATLQCRFSPCISKMCDMKHFK